MLAQFHRLLNRIAESNKQAFDGRAPSLYTLNCLQKHQMEKLRKPVYEGKKCELSRPVKGHSVPCMQPIKSS
jgi:hypothetical protein